LEPDDPDGSTDIKGHDKQAGDVKNVNDQLKSCQKLPDIVINPVDNRTQKDSNQAIALQEPSEPSDPSGQVAEESSTIVEHDLYWIESMSLWGCKHCSLKADKFGMENTPCKGNNKKR
jgi:hypothetical protein